MQQSWTSGTFWLALALQDLMTFSSIFWYRIVPQQFGLAIDCTTDFTLLLILWGRPYIIDKKLQDHRQYLKKLESVFMESD